MSWEKFLDEIGLREELDEMIKKIDISLYFTVSTGTL